MDIKEEKKKIRAEIRALKKLQTDIEKELASDKIARTLLHLPQIKEAQCILLYYSLPDEVLTEKLIFALSNKHGINTPYGDLVAETGKKRIILPVVEGEFLILKEYIPGNVENGYRDILEPNSGEIVDPAEIELAVIPGVAFDAKCNRIGRGKGFYDKLLPHINCTTIGLGYDFQIVPAIPCNGYDIPLDMVITESGCYCNGLK